MSNAIEPIYRCGPGYGTRGERAYNLRLQGKRWDEIVEIIKANSADAALAVARKYARTKGMPWPIERIIVKPTPEAPVGPSKMELVRERQKQAYESRLTGLDWARIAMRTSYKHVPHVIAAARRYAERSGKQWPVPVPEVETPPAV